MSAPALGSGPAVAGGGGMPPGATPRLRSVRVVHCSIIHPPFDTRIFHKECRTLAGAGYDVHLLVDSAPAGERDGVSMHPLEQRRNGRLKRLWRRLWEAYRAARTLRPDIYHFHDPILAPVALALKLQGVKVVFDVHEDSPREALHHNKDHRALAWVNYGLVSVSEFLARRFCDRFVCVTSHIAGHFPATRTRLVQNFPALSEFPAESPVPYAGRPPQVAYVGSITGVRGMREIVGAMGLLPPEMTVRLVIGGKWDSPALRAEVERLPGWARVDAPGHQTREGVRAILQQSRAGIVVLHPEPNYLMAQPTKLYEYMAAGLPVIASDFPPWRAVVQAADCGFLVDPFDTASIAEAIRWILLHPSEAEAMGRRGREAVVRDFSWSSEAGTLLSMYAELTT